MKTLFADLRQHGSDAGRSRPQVAGSVASAWRAYPDTTSTASVTICAINAIAAPAADRLMAKRTTFARKFHAQRPEETPNG